MAFRRALFIRFGGLGDILLATPTVRAVAQAFPGIAMDFVVGGGMADALTGHPLLRRVLCFDKRGVDSRLDHFCPSSGTCAGSATIWSSTCTRAPSRT